MIACILLGILIGIIINAFIVKDALYISDDKADTLKVVGLVKNRKHFMNIIVPKRLFGHLTTPTTLVLILNCLAVRLLPIKHLQFVDSKRIRIVVSIFFFIIFVFLLFVMYLNYHAILPTKTGYKIYKTF